MLEIYTKDFIRREEVKRRIRQLKEGYRLTFHLTNHPTYTALELEGFMDLILNLHPDFEAPRVGELTGFYLKYYSFVHYYPKRLIKRTNYLKRKSFFKVLNTLFREMDKYEYTLEEFLIPKND